MSTVEELAQELEFLRADLELLRQEVDSMNQYIRLQKISVDSMVTTLKSIIVKDCSGPHPMMLDGDTTLTKE